MMTWSDKAEMIATALNYRYGFKSGLMEEGG